jgi:N-acetylglucosamine-6-phosphate deacetylase
MSPPYLEWKVVRTKQVVCRNMGQVNGAGGTDLTSALDPATALLNVAHTLARHGVTAFCPTVVSSPLAVIVERLAAYDQRTLPGAAECLGAHIEGPFIDAAHRGVHEPAALRSATPDEIARWLEAGRPVIVTLAPEQPGALAAIEQLAAAGVVVSLAGSAMLLDDGLRNVRAWLPDLCPADLMAMVTQTPADLLGLTRKGRIEVGCDADFVVLDREFNVQMSFVRGQVCP